MFRDYSCLFAQESLLVGIIGISRNRTWVSHVQASTLIYVLSLIPCISVLYKHLLKYLFIFLFKFIIRMTHDFKSFHHSSQNMQILEQIYHNTQVLPWLLLLYFVLYYLEASFIWCWIGMGVCSDLVLEGHWSAVEIWTNLVVLNGLRDVPCDSWGTTWCQRSNHGQPQPKHEPLILYCLSITATFYISRFMLPGTLASS